MRRKSWNEISSTEGRESCVSLVEEDEMEEMNRSAKTFIDRWINEQ